MSVGIGSIKKHTCKIVKSSSSVDIYNEEGEEWRLVLMRCATNEDLENNHNLEYEEQTMEQVVIPIAFCPYCGEKLMDTIPEVSFQHHDFTKC